MMNSNGVKIIGGPKGYINPVKGESARILITAGSSGTVDIRAYTIMGEKVWEDDVDVAENITSVVSWNCVNENNSRVASGVYLFNFSGAGFSETHKVAVVK